MTECVKNRIGFKISDSFSSIFTTFNSASNSENGFEVYSVYEHDLEEAISLADKAFLPFSNFLSKKRAGFLLAICEKLKKNRLNLIEIFCLESSLSTERADIELKRTIFQLEEFADLISGSNWNFSSENNIEGQNKLVKYFKAIGPVVVFGASNFPFAYSTIGGDAASALAAGCPVIVKAHPYHAGTSDLVAKLVIEAARETGMPEGVFSNVNDEGFEVGEKLVQHPKMKAIGFTGSMNGGIAICKLAQSRKEPIPVYAEMGSVNPIFIFNSSLKNQNDLAKILAESIYLGAGQFCTSPGLIFTVKSKVSDKFIQDLANFLVQKEELAMLHPQIWKNYLKGSEAILAQKGVKELVKQENNSTNFIGTKLRSVSFENFQQNELLQKEVFGSHCLIVELENQDQYFSALKVLKGNLTLSIFSELAELEQKIDFLQACAQKTGRLNFNQVPTGVQVCEAMQHGGPFPSSNDQRFTAVGRDSIKRFLKPITYQNFPKEIVKLLTK